MLLQEGNCTVWDTDLHFLSYLSCFAKLSIDAPHWYEAALAQVHGSVTDFSVAERLVLAKFIRGLPASADKHDVEQAFEHVFGFEETKLEDAIAVLELQLIRKSLLPTYSSSERQGWPSAGLLHKSCRPSIVQLATAC